MSLGNSGCGRLVLGAMAGLSLLGFGSGAVAQHVQTYWGDDACGMCHSDKYASYLNHGHPWKVVRVAGQAPPADLYPASWGSIDLKPLPTIAGSTNPSPQVSWSDIEYIEGSASTNEATAFYIFRNGYRDSPGRPGDPTPKSTWSCIRCHNTGYSSSGHQLGLAAIPGTWALDGVQCEACHGPKSMKPAVMIDTVPSATVPLQKGCQTCHSGSQTDPTLPAGMAGLPFATAAPWVFTSNHAEGDEFSHSAHKNQTCWICHDPHRSVWHEDGGVLYSEPEGAGNMCKQCHQKELFVMKDVPGIECVSCHMPEIGYRGERAAHVWRISTDATKSVTTNVHKDTAGKTWWNVDTDPKSKLYGQSFLTLDLACGGCHPGASLAALATTAPYVHRPTGALGLTVNGSSQSPQVLGSGDNVTVAFSVYTDTMKGKLTGNADIYVACNGPKGWSYWNGSKWVTSKTATPYLKGKPVANISNKVVLNGKLGVGQYTYWVWMNQTGKPQNVVTLSVSCPY
jgi:hypothetical protein